MIGGGEGRTFHRPVPYPYNPTHNWSQEELEREDVKKVVDEVTHCSGWIEAIGSLRLRGRERIRPSNSGRGGLGIPGDSVRRDARLDRSSHTLDVSTCPGTRVFPRYEPNDETIVVEF